MDTITDLITYLIHKTDTLENEIGDLYRKLFLILRENNELKQKLKDKDKV